MPVSFPSFAFVREKFPHAFDETLKGGIDCDWVFRRSAVSPLKGNVVFCPVVYYREHEGQITATRKDTQLAVRRAAIASAYEKVLGPLSTPIATTSSFSPRPSRLPRRRKPRSCAGSRTFSAATAAGMPMIQHCSTSRCSRD